jgi:hypothetical protein
MRLYDFEQYKYLLFLSKWRIDDFEQYSGLILQIWLFL